MPIVGAPFAGVGVDPTILSAASRGPLTVVVEASEELADNAPLRDPASYTLTANGGSIARAILAVSRGLNGRSILLSVDGALSAGAAAYTVEVVVAGVTDVAGNPIGTPNSADVNVSPVETSSHVELAVGRLAAYYREKPSFVTMVEAYASRFDTLESAAAGLEYFRGIERGFGIRLDWIGELYGTIRNARSDAELRPILRAHARRLISRGRAEDMLDVMRLALDGAAVDLALEESYPASILIRADGIPDLLGDGLAELKRRMHPAAVHTVLFHAPAGVPLFAWQTSTNFPPGGSAAGWAQTPVGTPDTSGVWARAR